MLFLTCLLFGLPRHISPPLWWLHVPHSGPVAHYYWNVNIEWDWIDLIGMDTWWRTAPRSHLSVSSSAVQRATAMRDHFVVILRTITRISSLLQLRLIPPVALMAAVTIHPPQLVTEISTAFLPMHGSTRTVSGPLDTILWSMHLHYICGVLNYVPILTTFYVIMGTLMIT